MGKLKVDIDVPDDCPAFSCSWGGCAPDQGDLKKCKDKGCKYAKTDEQSKKIKCEMAKEVNEIIIKEKKIRSKKVLITVEMVVPAMCPNFGDGTKGMFREYGDFYECNVSDCPHLHGEIGSVRENEVYCHLVDGISKIIKKESI